MLYSTETITNTNHTILEPKDGVLTPNSMELHTGASNWGIGRFLTDSNELKNTSDLVLQSKFDSELISESNTKVTIQCVEASLSPISTFDPNADDDLKNSVSELTLYDHRCLLTQLKNKAYNVLDGDDWTTIISSTKDGSQEWTWASLLADLDISYESGLPPTTWKPRNLIFDNVPLYRVIDEIAAQLYCVAAWDHQQNKIILYKAQSLRGANSELLTFAAKYALNTPTTTISQNRMPEKIQVTFPRVNTTSTDPYTNRWYTVDVTVDNNGTGTKVIHLGNYIAVDNGSGVINTSTLSIIANDIATRAYKYMSQPIKHYKIPGIWNLTLDGSIRSLKWTSNQVGAWTEVGFGPIKDYQPHLSWDLPREGAYNNEITGLGEFRVSATAGSKYLIPKINVASDEIPAGVIVMYGDMTAPTGWLNCDGASLLRADYPDLFTAIGTTFGSVDATHFNVPDFVNEFRFPRQAGASVIHPIGDTGGFSDHGGGANNHNDHTMAFGVSPPYQSTAPADLVVTDGTHSLTDNEPPYIAVNFIIKT